MNIYINNHQIEQVKSIDYLGITIDSKLEWDVQLKKLETSLSTACGIMSKLRHFVTFDCLKSYYYAKVYSILQYAVLAWGGSNPTKLHRLNVLHNKSIRLMVQKNLPENMRISNPAIFKSLNILQLKDIYSLELGKFMHKAYYRDLPDNLNNMFTRIDSVHRYPTSSSRNRVYYQNRTITSAYQNWISTSGIVLWESITTPLQNKNFYDFRKAFRDSLIAAY